MIRAVVDPGVLISALIGSPESPPARIVDAWLDDRIELLVSPDLLTELRLVALRPKFRRWFDEDQARELIGRVERHATLCPEPEPAPGATRDAADDYLVALARAQRADMIISGDRDLLDAGLGDPRPYRPPRRCA